MSVWVNWGDFGQSATTAAAVSVLHDVGPAAAEARGVRQRSSRSPRRAASPAARLTGKIQNMVSELHFAPYSGCAKCFVLPAGWRELFSRRSDSVVSADDVPPRTLPEVSLR